MSVAPWYMTKDDWINTHNVSAKQHVPNTETSGATAPGSRSNCEETVQ